MLTARYFEEEVIGTRMLDRLGGELFEPELDPAAVMHTELAHEIESVNGTATLRIGLPFGERGEIGLKKVGAELIVSVGPAQANYHPPAPRSPAAARPAPSSPTARSR